MPKGLWWYRLVRIISSHQIPGRFAPEKSPQFGSRYVKQQRVMLRFVSIAQTKVSILMKICDSCGHSLHGSVDWNVKIWCSVCSGYGHSLHGRVDWNGYVYVDYVIGNGHSLCGSVDWNLLSWRCRLSDFASLPARKCELKIHKIKVVRQECECPREVYFCKHITIRIKRD